MKIFECSIHGLKGIPECRECWETLFKMLDDYTIHVILSIKDIKRYNIPQRFKKI
jgi:hypothetical protein